MFGVEDKVRAVLLNYCFISFFSRGESGLPLERVGKVLQRGD